MVTPSSQTRSCDVTVSASSFPCLQCVNICCVFVGDISFEVKTEADSNDITQYPYDDMPSTGMIVFHHECILCTMFDVLPVTTPRYVTRLYVCRKKISGKFIRPTTVFCRTDLLYQTQHEIQITAG